MQVLLQSVGVGDRETLVVSSGNVRLGVWSELIETELEDGKPTLI
jgi:thiamine phosphate synthase YjbQ (UPF0047 family)